MYKVGTVTAGITGRVSGGTGKNVVINGFLSGILFTGDNNVDIHNIMYAGFRGFQLSGQGPLGGHNVVK